MERLSRRTGDFCSEQKHEISLTDAAGLGVFFKNFSKELQDIFNRLEEGQASQPKSTISCWKNLPPEINNSVHP